MGGQEARLMKRVGYVLPGLIVLSVFLLLLWPLAASAQSNGPSGRLPSFAAPFGVIAGVNLLYQAFRIPLEPAVNIAAKFLLFISGFLLVYEVYIYVIVIA
jgi:hypothetical protein